ncbi:PLDc N-terminal domain-containing protein [Altererythrobacter fulvus]|uniref:PLDc N-terminal domain-containing protein n=1 Tax=Caenibius fulvus TaxID=2126012 RepID=UPI003016F6A0
MSYLLGIILLILDIWAIVSVLQSSASGGAKLAWSAGIVIFPLLGLIVWFLAGPKGRPALT